ncbi:MAG TPA: hypothetical protein VKU87_12280 [Thermomicrobiaceae bacterium]|nr:hypothetical protein [Thermomicrobiaceae bacterium]
MRNEREAINFRSQPGTSSSDATVIQGGTGPMFIGEQRTVGRLTRMHCMLQHGTLGGIRTIDVTTINPKANYQAQALAGLTISCE